MNRRPTVGERIRADLERSHVEAVSRALAHLTDDEVLGAFHELGVRALSDVAVDFLCKHREQSGASTNS